MHIDEAVLAKLEKLSHLRVDESKKSEIMEQLSEILEFVESLNELDTSSLDSFFSTLPGETPMREDEPCNNPDIPKEILSHAPMSEDDFFIVPAIIE